MTVREPVHTAMERHRQQVRREPGRSQGGVVARTQMIPFSQTEDS